MLVNLNIKLSFFLQATLQDLEQRRPQLEELITAAQNLKNKTSNQEARTIITDRSKSFNKRGQLTMYEKVSAMTWKSICLCCIHQKSAKRL